ncbi:MAG: DsbA family protein [Nitrososphaeraceae archaeon]
MSFNSKNIIANTIFIFIISSFLLSSNYINGNNVHNNNLVFAQQSSSGEFSIPIDQLITKDTPVLGNDDAPVTIFDFSDFQCPLCKRYALNTEPSIIENYVDTGKVKIAYKHFTIFGPDSTTASKISQCAKEQGKFWEFSKLAYENQKGTNSGWAGKDNLITLASQIPDLDLESLKSCADSTKYDFMIGNDLLQAKAFNFSGTPSFIIVNSDGSKPEIIGGAYPYPLFQDALDKKLSGK